jgi:hypothetical protein
VISGFGISAVFNPAGDRFYVRNNGGRVNVFTYNPASGGLGATPLFSISGIASTQTFLGWTKWRFAPMATNFMYRNQGP